MSHALYRIGHFAGRHPWKVIGAWVVIAVSIFMLNSAAGGSYDETFSLPGSESQAAADAIQDRFPQQTLYSSNVIFHSEDGLTGPDQKAVVEQAVEQLSAGPHVIAVSSPYDPRGPTLSEDGQTAFATVGFDVEKVGITEYDAAQEAVQAVRDAGIQVEYDGGLGYANLPAGGNSELIGIVMAVVHPGHRLRLARRDEPAHRDGPDGHRRRQQHHRHHVRPRGRPEDHRRRRHDARPRSRHRLRAVHPVPAPPEPGRRTVGARGHRPRQRDRRSVGALRRRHRDRRDPRPQGLGRPDDGDDGLRLGDHGRRRHARLDHAAARDARRRQAPGQQRPDPVRQAEAGLQPGRLLGALGRPCRRQARALRRRGSRGPRRPGRPGVLDAPRVRRRGQRRTDVDHPQGLRPDGRRLRPRHQRSAPGGARQRGCADSRRDARQGGRGPRRPGRSGLGGRLRSPTSRATSRSSR